MIIARLQGGVGNQLFQYSLGRHLAFKREMLLKLDTEALKNSKSWPYRLDHFAIAASIATATEIGALKDGLGAKIWNALMSRSRRTYIKETSFRFDPLFLEAGSDVYLDGYWQSEKYFKDIEDVIRKDIVLKEPQNAAFREMQEKMRQTDSVSMHIRRGDYLMEKHKKVFETCPPEYYDRALRLIAEKISSPALFVFSDDVAWTKENIHLPFPATFVSDIGFADYQELMLMSACKHHIIANSSFSWWGAWLDPNPGKIVVAPEKWFADATKDTSDLLPSAWIRL